jgi:hypothetical protein
MNTLDEKARIVLQPESFEHYIKALNLEPIEKVKERFEKVRPVNEMIPYINNGQLDKDRTRLELETGKVINKNQPGKFLVNMNPELVRRMYKPQNVINFYEKELKTVGKSASLESLNCKIAAITLLNTIKPKLRGFSKYIAALDEASWYLEEEPRIRSSERLYKLSSKLPKDKCASQIERIKTVAAQLNDPGYKDPGRVTTKGHQTLAQLMIETKGTVQEFLKKVEEWAKPEEKDTYKDRMVKQIYNFFIKHMEHHKTDTPQDMIKVNKEADELVSEIIKAASISQQLIDKIEKYKRTLN